LDRASLPAQFKDTSEARSAGMQSAAGSSAQPLARLVLGLLLVLLLGESFVARRLGDPSS
jgi:hypothetical protein